jgi:dTDP-4-dehydrorhamnose 3,5-epimerase
VNIVEEFFPGCYLIDPTFNADERGYFSRRIDFVALSRLTNFGRDWAACNRAYSKSAGTFRGMHFQKGEFAEVKIVSCSKGAVIDIILDIREGSPNYAEARSFELNEVNSRLIIAAAGVAHGYQTLEDDTSLDYLTSSEYSPENETGFSYKSSSILEHIVLPVTNLSPKDEQWPIFKK